MSSLRLFCFLLHSYSLSYLTPAVKKKKKCQLTLLKFHDDHFSNNSQFVIFLAVARDDHSDMYMISLSSQKKKKMMMNDKAGLTVNMTNPAVNNNLVQN